MLPALDMQPSLLYPVEGFIKLTQCPEAVSLNYGFLHTEFSTNVIQSLDLLCGL